MGILDSSVFFKVDNNFSTDSEMTIDYHCSILRVLYHLGVYQGYVSPKRNMNLKEHSVSQTCDAAGSYLDKLSI